MVTPSVFDRSQLFTILKQLMGLEDQNPNDFSKRNQLTQNIEQILFYYINYPNITEST